MEKKTTVKSIEINAPVSKVWEAITDPVSIRNWAAAFGHGTHADSEWKAGSIIEWKDMGGNVGAKGIITRMDECEQLKVDFFDDFKLSNPEDLGEYSEIYDLSGDDERTTLKVTIGPIEERYVKSFDTMWDRAMINIKNLCEN